MRPAYRSRRSREPGDARDEASSDAENAADAREAFDPRRHSVFATRGHGGRAASDDRDAAYDAAFDVRLVAWTEPSARGGKFLDVRLRRVEAAGFAAQPESCDKGPRPGGGVARGRARVLRRVRARTQVFRGVVRGAEVPVLGGRRRCPRWWRCPAPPSTRSRRSAAWRGRAPRAPRRTSAAFYEAVAGSASAPLARAQFLELLVRVADAKYAKSGAHHSLARALEALAETDVLPRAGAEALADPTPSANRGCTSRRRTTSSAATS